LACWVGLRLEPSFAYGPLDPQKCCLIQKWSKLSIKGYLISNQKLANVTHINQYLDIFGDIFDFLYTEVFLDGCVNK